MVIAGHVFANLGRRRLYRRAHELPDFSEMIASIAVNDDDSDVRCAVRRLPAKYREIIMLVH